MTVISLRAVAAACAATALATACSSAADPGAKTPVKPSDYAVTAEKLDPDTYVPYGPDRPTKAPARPCAARSGVTLESGPVEAAMGLRALTLTVTNCGKDPYRLNGYPALQVLDDERRPLAVRVHRGPEPVTSAADDPGPHPVTLKRGQAATASVLWRNTYTDTSRLPVNGTYLKVTPGPGLRTRSVTPDGGVDLGSTAQIGTTAWRKAPPNRPTAPRPTGSP
ncbi:DUF4232 domain-containing protein [Streptomyces sp. NPDC059063]|uniref:DUF4232 domain-containing protein n=1 Tax=unclassified Streptomyces TaxID=2593676 RepID=UPI003679947F